MAVAANEYGVNIKVVGVGGGGGNAVNRMIASNVNGVEFAVINTDRQALKKSEADVQLAIGAKITNGFGAGANPEIGKRAAEEAYDSIKKVLNGSDMVFLTAGMGGGTGSGAMPVVAKAARDLDILTIGVVTTPFKFEGNKKMKQARAGIDEMSEYVDSLVVIPNERLKMISDARISIANAFVEADEVLRRGVQSISDIINVPGFINIDFADITAVLKNSGVAYMGMGCASGKDKAQEAANMAISSPLLETSIKGANGVIISVAAATNVGLEDIDVATNMIRRECNEDANIIFGVIFDPELDDEMRITIIAAGFDAESEESQPAAEPTVTVAPQETQKNEEVQQQIDEELLADLLG